jgi:hypothetical protein
MKKSEFQNIGNMGPFSLNKISKSEQLKYPLIEAKNNAISSRTELVKKSSIENEKIHLCFFFSSPLVYSTNNEYLDVITPIGF